MGSNSPQKFNNFKISLKQMESNLSNDFPKLKEKNKYSYDQSDMNYSQKNKDIKELNSKI